VQMRIIVFLDLNCSKHPTDVPLRRHKGTLRQTSLSRGTPCAFLKVLAHFLNNSNQLHKFLFLHLRQIAPTEITAIIKSFTILGDCRKKAECQSKESKEKVKILPGRGEDMRSSMIYRAIRQDIIE